MKKFFFIFFVVIIFSACSSSKEDKAEKLVKKALNSVIVNMDTYEPIDTKIDSAFAPLMAKEVFKFYEQLPDQMRIYIHRQEKAEELKRKLNLYEDLDLSFTTASDQDKEEYEKACQYIKDFDEKMKAFNTKMEKKAKEKPVFCGYMVTHTYRYVNKEGEKTIGKHVFLMDKDLTEVESMIDLEDEIIKAFTILSEKNSFGE